MRVIGLAVAMQGESKATAYGVVVDNSSGTPVVADRFEITNDEADLATRLFDMAENIRTKVDSLKPDAVAVRRADFPPTGSRKEAPKVRLLAEGALVSAARSKCVATYMGTGRELGTWCGSDKDTVEGEARGLLTSAGLPQKFVGAACAALGGLARP
ncbi:hypothetical protein KM427_23055 [Nocardioides sp. LMS-CY]|uniref:hypothetical protein n=1 Tax=Nocardioides sp. (strain LMS-CY) TaxID=2840457 RepID=UPI001C00689A|nr:hypothetical protein [Nocardioides sp. LMS-CY]QWF21769.1 hypothetical protein KM427_23055 [Nocardioides sp. LMS-CY]